ncbi:protein CLP1 homolog isoform X2 [Dioscorea cayenensis subsp. rotundata]|uniref:Protein CLP1 homolog isoform X2 n=1 Tax=Dioscorea cayennensis subsp. rotundata TaxID=55577 RepID=A0AB40B267_DIOCR|nr:protein CLP1 homolog isoform X2 [Dioscorea cayenensis subsp. rotundata]
MLLSWACKKIWKPTFVDLDIGQRSVTIPGRIAATPVEMPIDAVERIPLETPIVYFYGHTSRGLAKELSRTLERQLSSNAESRAVGTAINPMGWVTDLGYELLLHAIDTFNPNVVLVVGQEKLCITLKNVLQHKPTVEVLELQKSGDVLLRKVKVPQKARNSRIREYFYGISNDLSPYSNTINFRDVCWIGSGPRAPHVTLPLGAEPAADPARVVPVKINLDLIHLVLAVSYAKEPEQLVFSNVTGFVYVTDIDIVRHVPIIKNIKGVYM